MQAWKTWSFSQRPMEIWEVHWFGAVTGISRMWVKSIIAKIHTQFVVVIMGNGGIYSRYEKHVEWHSKRDFWTAFTFWNKRFYHFEDNLCWIRRIKENRCGIYSPNGYNFTYRGANEITEISVLVPVRI